MPTAPDRAADETAGRVRHPTLVAGECGDPSRPPPGSAVGSACVAAEARRLAVAAVAPYLEAGAAEPDRHGAAMTAADPWPTEIRLAKDRRSLTVSFEGGESHSLSAEYLRVTSPSAEVQGHSPAEKKTVPGKREVAILAVEPVGNYAVRLTFDDMHSTGIYGWAYLASLGRERERIWGQYLADLAAKGLSRDRTR